MFRFVLTFLLCAFFSLGKNASFLLCLILHRLITSTPTISLLFSSLFVQCECVFSSSHIPSVHMFQRSLMTDSNILRCQNLSDSIIFMICEMITGLYLCKFDSRGIKFIHSIVMFLYLSTTLCRSII